MQEFNFVKDKEKDLLVRPTCIGDYNDYGSDCEQFFPQCLKDETTQTKCPADILSYNCSFTKDENGWAGVIS